MTRHFRKSYNDVMARADITHAAKSLYTVIANYQGNKDHAWPSILQLAKDIGGSDKTVQRGVNQLEAVGLITIEHRGERKVNWYRITESAPISGTVGETATAPKMSADSKTSAKTHLPPKCQQPAPKMSADLPPKCPPKKKRLIKDLKKKATSPAVQKPKTSTTTKKPFIKPTIEDLKEEIRKKGYSGVDADEFYLKYEANGWRVQRGTKPMESWRLTLYRWHKNEQERGNSNGQKTTKRVFSTEAAPGEAVFAV